VVRDTGVGIDSGSMDLIFERFRQIDGSMSRIAGGAGLGLSIVRQIVELLGGDIRVESRIGEGSAFLATLPLIAPDPDRLPVLPSAEPGESSIPDAAAAGLEAQAPAPAEDAADTRPLILIVEDDPDTAALLSETITGGGFRVRVAVSGSVGLMLARELLPAAITLDVMMPGMDGWRVLQSLKSHPATAEIPVIVCSIIDNRALGYRLGASGYLIKPFDPEQLTSALHDVSGDPQRKDGYVLIVDDEHGVRELLAAALQRTGYEVRTAASGEIALGMIEHATPQAVLSDLMMPGGMSGFELIARLRSDPRTEHTPILVVTGKDITPEDRQSILGQITNVIRKGDLLMSDLETRLRKTLEELGVKPVHAENPAG
jgi:CheY-like chemotaxis protein